MGAAGDGTGTAENGHGAGIKNPAGLIKDPAGIQVDGGRGERAVLEIIGAGAASGGGQGQGAGHRVAAAALGEGGRAGVADGAVGGVEGAAGLVKGAALIHFQTQAIQGHSGPAGQGQGGGGVLGQAVAGGKVAIEGGRAVIQEPAAEQTAGVGIGAPVFQAALDVAALVVEGGGTQAAAGLIKDPAGIQVDGGGGERAVLEIIGAGAASGGGQGQGAGHRVAAAALGEGGRAGVADGAVGGVEGAAGLIKGAALIHFQALAVQGQGAAAGQGQGGGGVLGQAVARGKVATEGGRAVIQEPAAEQTAGVGIGAPVFQAALDVAALVVEGGVIQGAAGLVEDPAGFRLMVAAESVPSWRL